MTLDTNGSSQGGTRIATNSGAAFLVRSELMQDYATARAVPVTGAQLRGVTNGEGELRLFCVGDGGKLFLFFPTSKGAGGWAVQPLHAPVEVVHLAAGKALTGEVIVLVAGSDGHVHWKEDRPWSSWTDLGQPFGVGTVGALRAGYDTTGELVFQAISEMPDSTQMVVRIDPRRTDYNWDYVSTCITGRIYDCVPGAGSAGAGTFASCSDQAKNNTNITYYLDHQIEIRSLYASQLDEMVSLAGTVDAEGITQIFGLSEQRFAYYFSPSGGATPIATNAAGQPMSFATIQASRLHVDGQRAQMPLQFFGVSTSGGLYVSNQQLPQEDAGITWSALVPLGDGLQSTPGSFTLCRDDQGVTHCFCATVDGQLLHVWQDATTSWHAAPINVPYEGELLDFASYSTEITVLDETGAPLPAQGLLVSASDYLSVTVNGQIGTIGPDRSISCQTNGLGRITIASPTTDLGTPSFDVSAAFLSDGALHIAPDRYIQDFLYQPTPQDLQTALTSATYTADDGTQAPLIDQSAYGDYMEGASQAIWQSMSLAMPMEGDPAVTARVVSKRGDTRGVSVLPRGLRGNRIDTARVPEQYWRIEFLERGVRFHRLRDNDEFERMRAELSSRVSLSTAASRSDASRHHPTWGNLWHSVKRGAAKLQDVMVKVVSTVVVGTEQLVRQIATTIYTDIAEGLEYVVDTIKQVFDVVQGVFAALAASFENVFRWLGSVFGTLFDWSAIVQAHDAIGDFLGGFINTTLPRSIEHIKDVVDQFLEQFTTRDTTLGPAGAGTLGEGYNSTVSGADQAPGPSSNWLQNQMVNSGGGAPSGAVGLSAPSDNDPLQAFGQAVSSELGYLTDTIIEQFQIALATGKSATDLTPNQILSIVTTMIEQDLLAAVKTVADLAFDLAEFVVRSIGQVVATPWHIPLVSRLYKQKLGRDMSLLDLAALVIALPATVTLRAAGKSLDGFTALSRRARLLQENLTPAQLFGRAPIDAETRERLRRGGLELDEDDGNAASVLGICYGIALATYAPFMWAAATDVLKNKWVKLIPAGASLFALAFSCPLIWSGTPESKDDAITLGCWALAVLLWIGSSGVPSLVKFRSPSPEEEPLVPGPARTPLIDRVSGAIGFAGGIILMGAYLVQAAHEVSPSSGYDPDAENSERLLDVGTKTVQNLLSVLPTAAMPLTWRVFEPYGSPAYGMLSVLGGWGSGAIAVIRGYSSFSNDKQNHVI